MELFLEMVPPENLFLTQIFILIFLGRLSEFSNFLENTAVFLQVESFLFSLSRKGLVKGSFATVICMTLPIYFLELFLCLICSYHVLAK